MPTRDLAKLRATQRRYRERNRDSRNARKRAAYAARGDEQRERSRRFRKENAAKVNSYNARWAADYRANLRAEFIAEYGGACQCCGESETLFLQIDHINNDGAAHRRAHRTAAKMLAVMKREGWPKDRYRLLCANCNHGRALNGGICPHQQK